MRSSALRKPLFVASYLATVAMSATHANSLGLPTWARIAGLVAAVLSAVAMARIHSMYPPRHDEPSDFPELLTEGPYAICRHPLYACTLANLFSIAIAFDSSWGLATCVALLPLWIALIRLEERELVEYWGERYREYASRVPALIPIPRKRRR